MPLIASQWCHLQEVLILVCITFSYTPDDLCYVTYLAYLKIRLADVYMCVYYCLMSAFCVTAIYKYTYFIHWWCHLLAYIQTSYWLPITLWWMCQLYIFGYYILPYTLLNTLQPIVETTGIVCLLLSLTGLEQFSQLSGVT